MERDSDSGRWFKDGLSGGTAFRTARDGLRDSTRGWEA